MAKFGGAFMALFLDKKARKNLKNRPEPVARQAVQAPLTLQDARPEPRPTPQDINNRLEDAEKEMERKREPGRVELIKNAMKIRNEQAKLLEQLSEEQRQKLKAIAVTSFLNGGKD